jgi:hypothetical protein
MTRSISFNLIGKIKEAISEIGQATRRFEKLQKIRVEAKTLEGIEFKALPEGREYLRLPFGNLFFHPESEAYANVPANLRLNEYEEQGKGLSAERLMFFDLMNQAARLAGYDIEMKKLIFLDRKEPVILVLIKPAEKFDELVGRRFEEQKALTAASVEFEKFFDFHWDETDLVAVKSRN